MEEKPKKVIVKRIKKGHAGAHGGSWKVAYADFVTAMMAFFLLMWLLNMTSQEKRAVLALYFRDFSLFQEGGKSFMMEGNMKPVLENKGHEDVVESGEDSGGLTKDDSSTKVLTGLAQKSQLDRDQVFATSTEDGIRIQIVDTAENPIFPAGSPQMTESGKKIVAAISAVLRNFPNELVIEGHTDASPTRSEQISNWELSTLRASAARRELEIDGIDPRRIAKVVGFADKDPLIRDHPEDPRNRRITIFFIGSKKQKPVEDYDWLWKKPAKGK